MQIKPKPVKQHNVCTVEMAQKLLANGYIPLPSPKGERGTRLKGWNQWSEKTPTSVNVREWFQSHDGGAALLCGDLIALDVDIDDADLCNRVCAQIESIVGAKTITRFGNAPRRTLFYRASRSTIKKVAFRVDNTQQVEILAKGANCMAFGIHHKTGKPYRWEGESPLDTPFDKLPTITEQHIESIGRYLHGISDVQFPGFQKVTDGREEQLTKLVFHSLKKLADRFGIESIAPEQIAMDAWAVFQSTVDLSKPKGSNPSQHYTLQDALEKARYVLGRAKNGSIQIAPYKGDNRKAASYSDYQAFFDYHLQNAKKDLVSGNVYIPRAEGFVDAANMLDILASHADETPALSPHKLKAHLARYSDEMKHELLVAFPQWDGVDRIKKAADCLKVRNLSPSHVEALLKDWGANVFRRIENPRNQNRVLALQGKQGIGKDYWLNEMFAGLRHYYGQLTMERDEKESLLAVSEHIVMSIGEFERVTPKALGFFKHMVTAEQADIRKPYAKRPSKHSLRCSFVATSNNKSLLQDTTGNRRFIVFELEGIDWHYPKGESLQMLAQFKHLADTGFKASTDAESALAEYLKQHTPDDPEKVALELFDTEMQRMYRLDGTRQIDYSQAAHLLERIGKQAGLHPNSISNILNRNGRRKHTSTGRVYFCPDLPKQKPLVLMNGVKGMKGKKHQNIPNKA